MKRLVDRIKLEMNGVVLSDVWYTAEDNHGTINDHCGGGCLFSGYILEADEVFIKEKKRLKRIAEKYGANLEA